MQAALEDAVDAASWISLTTSQGNELRATILKLSHLQVVFEIPGPGAVLRTSEVLQDFKILTPERALYAGHAVIVSLVNAGTVQICEAALQDSWIDSGTVDLQPQALRDGFEIFFNRWEKLYKIRPEYKLVISDLLSFITDMRLWLDQVELSIRSLPSGDRIHAEREVVDQLAKSTTPAFSHFFEQFERAASEVEKEARPAHAAFCRRQLHPVLLASPFMHRIFVKPLGYAGDYEMVNMILRDPCEGASLFAKLLNVFILSQTPAVAHRNRVSYLTSILIQETARVAQTGRKAKILNLGCGPAKEVQNFLTDQEVSNHADFELMDFDEQTLSYLRQKLESLKHSHNRRTGITIVRKSVQQLLKQVGKPKAPGQNYDLIYCAGLFDYLNDRTCKSILAFSFDSLAPGGLLAATNVESQNPIRNIMEYLFEWYLIYRSGVDFARLAPDQVAKDDMSVRAETSGGNILLEIRKPR
jgi:extracellular factor (EF) 3-hydroxypalmitic acid methyl ester biosynthesis protein